ncbi:hypothetical protein GCM10010266_68390 [Streptomyces griseomycini]|nr:hypothetical protein GCM10010266_68390 [Streptomyces griseomycini]
MRPEHVAQSRAIHRPGVEEDSAVFQSTAPAGRRSTPPYWTSTAWTGRPGPGPAAVIPLFDTTAPETVPAPPLPAAPFPFPFKRPLADGHDARPIRTGTACLVARRQIADSAEVMQQHPRLNSFGIGVFDPLSKTAEQRRTELASCAWSCR